MCPTGDQELLCYAKCQLTNTCFERMTEDLPDDKTTTSKIIDKQCSSNTQSTLSASENETPLSINTQVSLHTTDEPIIIEGACCSETKQDFNAALGTLAKAKSTASRLTEVTHRRSKGWNEAPKASTVSMATDDAIESTQPPEPPAGIIAKPLKITKFRFKKYYVLWHIMQK